MIKPGFDVDVKIFNNFLLPLPKKSSDIAVKIKMYDDKENLAKQRSKIKLLRKVIYLKN